MATIFQLVLHTSLALILLWKTSRQISPIAHASGHLVSLPLLRIPVPRATRPIALIHYPMRTPKPIALFLVGVHGIANLHNQPNLVMVSIHIQMTTSSALSSILACRHAQRRTPQRIAAQEHTTSQVNANHLSTPRKPKPFVRMHIPTPTTIPRVPSLFRAVVDGK